MTYSAKHQNIASAFDAVANDYDTVYGSGGNAAMVWMRHENLAHLRSLFPSGSRLLEIGCGTGEEAIALARAGCSVVASDISPTMVRVTLDKAEEAGVADRVQGVALPAGLLSALSPQAPFDGIYTSFGGLNCEPSLESFGRALRSLVRPGGVLVCGVMGRSYLFEVIWYLAQGRLRDALRRLGPGWKRAPVSGGSGQRIWVTTRYLGLRTMRRVVGDAFSIEEVRALPLLMPPPYAASLYERYPRIVSRLEVWDRCLRRQWPFSLLGDHLVLVFRRRACSTAEPSRQSEKARRASYPRPGLKA